jgi:hypothetical protein
MTTAHVDFVQRHAASANTSPKAVQEVRLEVLGMGAKEVGLGAMEVGLGAMEVRLEVMEAGLEVELEAMEVGLAVLGMEVVM